MRKLGGVALALMVSACVGGVEPRTGVAPVGRPSEPVRVHPTRDTGASANIRGIQSPARIVGAACATSSQVATVWQLYLIVGVLTAAGVCAVTWVPSGALVSQWFADRRASMLGLVFSGMGVGVLTIGPLTQWLIEGVGWRGAYFALGVGTLLLLWAVVPPVPSDGVHPPMPTTTGINQTTRPDPLLGGSLNI